MLLKDTIERYYKLQDFQRYLVNKYIMRTFAGGLTCFDDENAIAVPDDFRKSIKFTCDLCGGYPIQLLDTSKGIAAARAHPEAKNEFTQIVLRAENIKSYEDFEAIIKRDVSAEVREDAQKAIAHTRAEEQAKAQAAVRAKQAAEAVAATEAQRRAEALRAKEMFEQQARRAEQSRMQAEQYAVATDQARKKAEEREYWLHAAVQQALAETELNFKQERAKWKKERKSLQQKATKVIATASVGLILAMVIFVLVFVIPNMQPGAKKSTLIFNPCGGVLSPLDFTKEGNVGDALILPKPLPPESGKFSDGYRFAGWCLSALQGNGNGDPVSWLTFQELGTGSLAFVLYAKWEIDPNGSSVLGPQSQKTNITVTGNQIYIRLAQNEANYSTTEANLRTDLVFSPESTPKVYLDSGCVNAVAGSVSLSPGVNIVYLKVTSRDGVTSKTYTVTIFRNTTVELTFRSGLGEETKIETLNGEIVPAALRPANPSKAGYGSGTWTFTEGGDSSNSVSWATFKPEINMVLHARYIANINKITFDANSIRYGFVYGSVKGNMSSQEITTDTTRALKSNAFEVSGYRFLGWTTDQYGATVVCADKADFTWSLESLTAKYGVMGNTVFSSSGLTLYALWEKIA